MWGTWKTGRWSCLLGRECAACDPDNQLWNPQPHPQYPPSLLQSPRQQAGLQSCQQGPAAAARAGHSAPSSLPFAGSRPCPVTQAFSQMFVPLSS